MTLKFVGGTSGTFSDNVGGDINLPSGLASGDVGFIALLQTSDLDRGAFTGWTKYAGPTVVGPTETERLNIYYRTMNGGAGDADPSMSNAQVNSVPGYGTLWATAVWRGYTVGAFAHGGGADDQDTDSGRTIIIPAHVPGGTYPSTQDVRHVYAVAACSPATLGVDTRPSGWSQQSSITEAGLYYRRLSIFSEMPNPDATEPSRNFKWTSGTGMGSLGMRASLLLGPTPDVDPTTDEALTRVTKTPLRRTTVKELPHSINTAMLSRVKDADTKQAMEEILRAISANQDHHQGQLRENARMFAMLADDLVGLQAQLTGPGKDEAST